MAAKHTNLHAIWRTRFWRFASPSTLLLALLLFPLPWMQIQCRLPNTAPNTLTRLGVPKPVADVVTPSGHAVVMITQSGWQAARGECTRTAEWNKMVEQSKASAQADDRERAQKLEEFEERLQANLHGSWLMTAYPIVMLSAVIAGLALPRTRARIIALMLLIATALTLVALQHSQGFPLACAYLDMPEDRAGEDVQPPPAETADARLRDLRYTPWFWLAQQLTVAALGIVLVEWWRAPVRAARTAPPQPVSPATIGT